MQNIFLNFQNDSDSLVLLKRIAYYHCFKLPMAKLQAAKPMVVEGNIYQSTYEDLLSLAQSKYPNKAGKIEMHHIHPKYIGGDPYGETVPLDAAYHQMITNEFRNNWRYGQGVPPYRKQMEIMKEVYKKYPLPRK